MNIIQMMTVEDEVGKLTLTLTGAAKADVEVGRPRKFDMTTRASSSLS